MYGSQRNIAAGLEYDKYFEKPKGLQDMVLANGDVYDTVATIERIIKTTLPQTTKISSILKRQNRYETCKAIYDFMLKHIQYRLDNRPSDISAVERIRTPARTWADRRAGVDCEDYAIFASSILTNLSIPNGIRITKYNHKDYFQHIYGIVPYEPAIVADKPRGAKNYITLDLVVESAFDYEVPFTEKKDYVILSEFKASAYNSQQTGSRRASPAPLSGIDIQDFDAGNFRYH